MSYKKDLQLNIKNRKNSTNRDGGFVVLVAILLASLFVLIGASIFTLSIRELALSFGAKESQYSFYAADSGVECAIYWDFQGKFATSTHSVNPTSVICMNQDITLNDWWDFGTNSMGSPTNPTNNNQGHTRFGFYLFPNDPTRSDCVIVWVSKSYDPPSKIYETTIESRGYNTCDEESSRRFERALRVTY